MAYLTLCLHFLGYLLVAELLSAGSSLIFWVKETCFYFSFFLAEIIEIKASLFDING